MSPPRRPADDTGGEHDPEERLYSSVPLDTGDGEEVIRQQNVGRDAEAGSGEWPDPHTPPHPPGTEKPPPHGQP